MLFSTSADFLIETCCLPRRAPHVLEVSVALGQAVDGVVGLAHGADEAAEGVGLVLASVPAVLVHLCDRDLHAGVVLGLDDAVGRRALARDVTVSFVSSCRMVNAPQAGRLLPGGIGATRTGRQARHVHSPLLRM